MYLAMVWNWVDIAEEKIFSNRELVWKEGELDMVMTKALLMEREAFIELLILNGFSMHKFLSVKKLRDLYNEAAERHTHLLEQINKFVGPCTYIYLRAIHKYLLYVMKRHCHKLYQDDRPMEKIIEKENDSRSNETFEEPFFELFIWAVLCNKAGLTEFFWVRSGSPLVAALFAASVYGVLAKMYELKGGAQRALTDLKYAYVSKANSIMELAMTKDKDKAVSLVDKRYERFGHRSLVNIGYGGHLKSFI